MSLSVLHRICAGAVGGFVVSLVSTPLDVIKTRIQVARSPSEKRKALLDLLHKPVQLYRGLSESIMLMLPMNSLYYPTYDILSKFLASSAPNSLHIFVPMVSGAVSRLLGTFIIAPVDLLRTVRQADPKAVSSFKIAKDVFKTRGIRGFWTGVGLAASRDAPFSAVYWAVVDKCRKSMASGDAQVRQHFTCGALAGILSTLCTHPVDVAKSRAQASLILEKGVRKLGFVQSLKAIWHEEGMRGMTSGVLPRCIKVAPSAAIMTGTYEIAKKILQSRYTK